MHKRVKKLRTPPTLLLRFSCWSRSFIVGWFIVIGCSSNQLTRERFNLTEAGDPNRTENTLTGNEVIRQGDQVKISVAGYPEFDTTSVVGETGTIAVRLVGELPVVGLTKAQLTELLTARLGVYIRSKVTLTVSVIDKAAQNVTVLGAVERQGNYPATTEVPLLQIIAAAGGSTPESDLRHIRVFRKGDFSRHIEVDLSQNMDRNPGDLPKVGPGDTVYVPKEENIVRELSGFFRDVIFLFSFFTLVR